MKTSTPSNIHLGKLYIATIRPKSGRTITLKTIFRPEIGDLCEIVKQRVTGLEEEGDEPAGDDWDDEQSEQLADDLADHKIALEFLRALDAELFNRGKDQFEQSLKIAGVTIGTIRLDYEPIYDALYSL